MPDTVIDPRDLDVRVARKVYRRGVRFLVGYEDEEAETADGASMEPARRELGWYEIKEDGSIGRKVPLFSTDIATAQKICEDFPVTVESDGAGKYRWKRRPPGATEKEYELGEWEGDMAMAICHGALAHAKAETMAEREMER